MKVSQSKEAMAIRGLLRNRGLNRIKVWSILTALRGPDWNKFESKSAVTGLIRGRLGLEVIISKKNIQFMTITRVDNNGSVKIRKRLEKGHYQYHAKEAFKALDLKWNEVNE